MRDKNWRTGGVAMLALASALMVVSASLARAQNKSPPGADHSPASISEHVSPAEMKPSMPLQPGDSVICTIPQGKKKARKVEIRVNTSNKMTDLCPPGRKVTGFVYAMGNAKRHVISVDHAAPPVGDGVP